MFVKIIKADHHIIPTYSIDKLVDKAMKTAKFAKDMEKAKITIPLKNYEKILEISKLISDQLDEIKHNII